MSIYMRTDRRCHNCLRFPDFTGQDMLHWRSCVSKRDWPEFQAPPADKASADCECGWSIPLTSKRPSQALGLHRAKARIHQEAAIV